MNTDEEYTAYVSGRLLWLRRIAYALCQDWHRADDLVQAAITRLYVKWRHAREAADLDAYVRVILVRLAIGVTDQPGARP
ncbi:MULTISPECIES: sigma factor [unclassified Nonomuraea]|uniref:sigma factor n=1 Tax=unclassified Nonomuraea TaxID=2593643 RepID=UPI0033C51186